MADAKKSYTRSQLHTLDEVAAVNLPADLKDGRRWLATKVRAGDIAATKIGRTWYMTDGQIAAMFEGLANRRGVHTPPKTPEAPPETAPAASIVDGLSERSRRRLRRIG